MMVYGEERMQHALYLIERSKESEAARRKADKNPPVLGDPPSEKA